VAFYADSGRASFNSWNRTSILHWEVLFQNTLHICKIEYFDKRIVRVPNIVTVFSDSVLSKYYMKKVVIQQCHIQIRHSELSVR
jgi:hypothetical protein